MGLFDLLFGKREMDVTGSINKGEDTVKKDESFLKVGSVEFEMEVEDVFSIVGRGTVVTGKVSSGTINVGDEVLIFNNGIRTKVTGIEMFRKQCDNATVGDNVGILLNDVSRDDVERGFLIIK